MSLFPLYKQQGSQASGLLKRGFPSTDNYEFSVELAAPATSGLTIAPSITKNSGVIEGAISSTYAEGNTRIVSKVDLKEDLNINYTLPGYKLGTSLQVKPAFEVSSKIRELDLFQVKPSIEVRHESFSLTGSVNVQPRKATIASPAFTFLAGRAANGLAFGVDIVFQASQLSKVNGLISFNKAPIEATFFSNTSVGKDNAKTHKFGATFYETLSGQWDKCAVGAEAEFPLDNPARPTLTLGASKVLDSLSSVKARLTTKGFLGFSYTQKFASPVQLIVSGEVNINEIHTPNALRYGLKLIFG